MSKKIYIIILLLFCLCGCGKTTDIRLEEYLNSIDVPEKVMSDFVLPREVNAEKDHVITWESSDESIVKISNIITIAGLEYYNVKVTRLECDMTITLKAIIDLDNNIQGIKDFVVIVKEDTTVRDAKIKYVKEILKKYENIAVRDNVQLINKTDEYELSIKWSSSNEQVISSNGTYNAPEIDTKVEFDVIVNEGSKVLYETKITFIAINKNIVEKEVLLDFVSNFDSFASNWGSGYESKLITNKELNVKNEIKIEISRANRQAVGNPISDRPVIAGKNSTEYITVSMGSDSIKNIEFGLMKWTTKTFNDIHIEYYDGSKWIICSSVITEPENIKSDEIPSGVLKIRLSVTTTLSKNTQLGLSNIKIELN